MKQIYQQLYNRLPVSVQNVLLTVYSAKLDRERYGEHFRHYRALLQEMEWWSEDEIVSYQEQRLRELCRHAYRTTAYYRRIFDERDLKPEDIGHISDLQKIPLLTREDIKQHGADMMSSAVSARKVTTGYTSGTTGAPLQLKYDPQVLQATYAALDRQYQWAGGHLGRNGNRVAVLRGNLIVPINQDRPPFWRTNRYYNQMLLSSYHLSDSNMPHYVTALTGFRPEIIDGFPSSLYTFACFLIRRGISIRPKAIISSSEPLYPFQREQIEEAFQARVYDYYAMGEKVAFSTQCDHRNSQHLVSAYGITEIVDDDSMQLPRGQVGRLVATSLCNYAMPLLRYVTNDMTCLEPVDCGCGRKDPVMQPVTTRLANMIVLQDGRQIAPTIFVPTVRTISHTSIRESQIIQEDYTRFRLRIVAGENFRQEDIDYLITEMKMKLGDEIDVAVDMVDELQRTRAGKIPWIISRIAEGMNTQLDTG